MPIICDSCIPNLTEAEFKERDFIVMRCAYASQNKLGRLCDEKVYERDLVGRLRAEGLPNVLTQVPIVVRHGRFEKEYRLDLVADGAVYELKAVESFARAHLTRAFHYAVCLGIKFIKLLNFRPLRVDGKLLACPITSKIRREARVDEQEFKPMTARCRQLREQLHALVEDLGGYLEADLYDDALGWLTGAPEVRLAVRRDGLELGTHPMRLLAERVGFQVSALSDYLSHHRTHLRCLLAALPLELLHWINFHHHRVMLTSFRQSGDGRAESLLSLA